MVGLNVVKISYSLHSKHKLILTVALVINATDRAKHEGELQLHSIKQT